MYKRKCVLHKIYAGQIVRHILEQRIIIIADYILLPQVEYNIKIILFQVCLGKESDIMYFFRKWTRTWTITRDNRKIYVRGYGKKAFRIKL